MKKYNINERLLSILGNYVEAAAAQKAIIVSLDIKVAANGGLSERETIRLDMATRHYSLWENCFVGAIKTAAIYEPFFGWAKDIEKAFLFWCRIQSFYDRIASGEMSGKEAVLHVIDLASEVHDNA